MACGKFTRHKRENVAVFVSCTRWLSVWKTFEDVDECLLTDFLMDANVALIFCLQQDFVDQRIHWKKNETPDTRISGGKKRARILQQSII